MFNGDVCLSKKSVGGGIYSFIGDFTGHGLSAAIGTMPMADIFFAMSSKGAAIEAIVREMNTKLMQILPPNMFCCAIIIHISNDHRRLRVWSGGMHEVYLLNEDSDIIDLVRSQHMPLGLLEDFEFEEDVVEILLPPKTRVLAYTDGLVEAENHGGEQFGTNRLRAAVLSSKGQSLIPHLLNAVTSFKDGADQDDDLSMVEVFCDCERQQQVNLKAEAQRNVRAQKLKTDTHLANVLPWQFKISLNAAELRRDDALLNLVSILQAAGVEYAQSSLSYTIISELFNNALEHGLLQLDSSLKSEAEGFEQYYDTRKQRLHELKEGNIEIDLSIRPPETLTKTEEKYVEEMIMNTKPFLDIIITDSGDGFTLSEDSYEKEESSYGRGLELLKALCHSLEYSLGGRRVHASLLLE
nr:SpoIIE family protein phosphatase [Marinibactrum halimedae]